MLLWLLLGYLLISVVFGVVVGTAIRMQGSGACDRPTPATATAPRPAAASAGELAGLGVQVATGG